MAERFWPSGLDDEARKGGDVIDALLVARECHAPQLLKGCFFHILCELLEKPHAYARMPPADLQRVLTARGELQRRWIAEVIAPPAINCSSGQSTCKNHSSQEHDQLRTWKEIMYDRYEDGTESPFQCGLTNPILALDSLAENVDWEYYDYCEVCAAAMKKKWADMRVKWWDDLDVLLGLEKEGDEDGKSTLRKFGAQY